eukprot:6381507-Heterocapsa_arctica.AAC.1
MAGPAGGPAGLPAGRPPGPPLEATPGTSDHVAGIMKRLEATAKNVHATFLEELKNYRDIPLQDWPLPVGYQQRLAPAYPEHPILKT